MLSRLPGARGATPVSRRVVEQGKVITAESVAQAIQLGIEYDPQPPFDSGSTDKASPEIIELARNRS